MLNWANRFNICCFLDNHQYASPFQSVECLVGVGSVKTFIAGDDILNRLDDFCKQDKDWLFGHLNYDLKNAIEPLQSNHPDSIGFPDAFFFQPQIVLQLKDDACSISSLTKDPKSILAEIQNSPWTMDHGPWTKTAFII